MYGKIFERMFTGTMYGSGPVVFSVWAYVIANARPPGVVSLNPKLLAATIGCSTEEIRLAIEFLTRPDPESATKDEEGRRLVHIESLDYHVVSWQKYRDMRDEEERREYQRKWVAAKRASERKAVDKSCRQESTAIDGRQMSTKSTKAEAEAVKEKEDAANAAVVDVWRYGVDLLAGVGMTAAQARTFVGKLCRDWGEADVHDALMAATGKADPRSYARKWLEGRPKKGEAPPGVVFKHGQPTIGGFVA